MVVLCGDGNASLFLDGYPLERLHARCLNMIVGTDGMASERDMDIVGDDLDMPVGCSGMNMVTACDDILCTFVDLVMATHVSCRSISRPRYASIAL